VPRRRGVRVRGAAELGSQFRAQAPPSARRHAGPSGYHAPGQELVRRDPRANLVRAGERGRGPASGVWGEAPSQLGARTKSKRSYRSCPTRTVTAKPPVLSNAHRHGEAPGPVQRAPSRRSHRSCPTPTVAAKPPVLSKLHRRGEATGPVQAPPSQRSHRSCPSSTVTAKLPVLSKPHRRGEAIGPAHRPPSRRSSRSCPSPTVTAKPPVLSNAHRHGEAPGPVQRPPSRRSSRSCPTPTVTAKPPVLSNAHRHDCDPPTPGLTHASPWTCWPTRSVIHACTRAPAPVFSPPAR
jgi:hypothetical protein